MLDNGSIILVHPRLVAGDDTLRLHEELHNPIASLRKSKEAGLGPPRHIHIDQPQRDEPLYFLGRVGVACDAGVDVGLLAVWVVVDEEQDLGAVRRTENRPDNAPGLHSRTWSSQIKWIGL